MKVTIIYLCFSPTSAYHSLSLSLFFLVFQTVHLYLSATNFNQYSHLNIMKINAYINTNW